MRGARETHRVGRPAHSSQKYAFANASARTAGSMYCEKSRAMSRAHAGDTLEGFRMTVFPAAIAPATGTRHSMIG